LLLTSCWISIGFVAQVTAVRPDPCFFAASGQHFLVISNIDLHDKSKVNISRQLFDTIGIRSFTVTRENDPNPITFTAETAEDWSKRASGKAGIPTANDLLGEIHRQCDLRPELAFTRLQELSIEHDFTFILTPPYTPSLQPIETVWAVVKNRVANEFTGTRTVTQLRDQTFYAFDTVDNHTVQGLYYLLTVGILSKRTWPYANELIKKIDGLHGTIDNLSTSYTE
jgi:hypothetical protein